MSISQVPGPDPKSLGGQCLPVTAKLPCLSKYSDNSLPSHGPGEQSGTSFTPLHLIQIPHSHSRCSSLPHCVRLGVFLLLWTPMGPPILLAFLYVTFCSQVSSCGAVCGYLILYFSSCLALHHQVPPTHPFLSMSIRLFSCFYVFLPGDSSPLFSPFLLCFFYLTVAQNQIHFKKYLWNKLLPSLGFIL